MPTTNDRSHSLVQWLSEPSSYPEGTQCVLLVETHISWVFLTDSFAYKLKKPVHFEFVDFSDVEARHRACQDEVRLNRRLAPSVYLGVVPVCRDPQGQFRLGGEGEVVDWMVKMRRLADSTTLRERIDMHQVSDVELEDLVSTLVDFYRAAARPAISGDRYHADLVHHVQANQSALQEMRVPISSALVRRIHQRQLRFLWLRPEVFHERVSRGSIVDGHGDLRPEHIFLEEPPQVIDCIEFSEEYRRLDVADELSFLAMECDRLGAQAVGRQLVERCQKQLSDVWPPALIEFYTAYRACVRAKVTALRAAQLTEVARTGALRETLQYLELADRCAVEMSRPLLLIVGGLMGTGKSTLASALGRQLGGEVLQTDAIRRALFGQFEQNAEYGAGLYSAHNRAVVYDRLFEIAAEQLAQQLSVILDGTFLSSNWKTRARDLAEHYGATAVCLRCTCPEQTAQERIARRQHGGQSLSDARPELIKLQRQEEETAPPGLVQVDIDTTQSLQMQLSNARESLTGICLSGRS